MNEITYEDVKKVADLFEMAEVKMTERFITRERMLALGYTEDELNKISEDSSLIGAVE